MGLYNIRCDVLKQRGVDRVVARIPDIMNGSISVALCIHMHLDRQEMGVDAREPDAQLGKHRLEISMCQHANQRLLPPSELFC